MDLLHAAGYNSSSSSSSLSSSPQLSKNKRGSSHSSRPLPVAAVKKQKLAQFITIASYDDNAYQQKDQSFERSNPHWEGRWAGHIYLPFPNMASLDLCDTDAPTHDETNNGTAANILADDDSDSDSDESSVSSMEEEGLHASRSFLPAARALIHYWAALINEAYADDDDDSSGIAIVPHLSMSPKKTKHKSIQPANAQDILHISLSRPIYLPAPSVDSFLADISSRMASVHSAARRHGHCNSHTGRTIHLRPHDATIFINDNQTRSFLSIPISEESSRWVKNLLPPIDASMLRFGQKTYYDEGIMHVSIASVKGNMIPIILKERRNDGDLKQSASGNESKIRNIPLFQTQGCNQLADETRNSIPESIPIRLNRIQCDFGKMKNMLLPL